MIRASGTLAVRKTMKRREDQRFLTGKGRYADNTAPADALRRAVRALAACACADRRHRQDRGARVAGRRWRSTRPRTRRPTGSATCRRSARSRTPTGNRHREPPHLPMPIGKVRHVGDIVAMVIAGTLDQARDAAEALVVDYEPLPAVVTVAQALAPGAPLLHDDAPGNLMCRWQQGRRRGDRCRLRQGRARHDALDPLAAPGRALHGNARGVVGLRRRPTTSSPSPSPRRACRSRTG